jgi:LPXTG-site transpeptidase (sortase) family protein
VLERRPLGRTLLSGVSPSPGEGTGEGTLGLAVGHIPGTSFPGQPGNVAVAGHRDTLFRSLRKIRDDDIVRFETLGGNYEYRVKSTEIVKPEDVSVLKPGHAPELTLVTCYPFDYFGSAPDRFIVKARQVPRPAPREAEREADASAPPPPPDRSTKPDPTIKKVSFFLSKNHSRELAPGISLGVTQTDAIDKSVNGWMWVMPDRRTIWLRDHNAQDPVIFYGDKDGRKRELLITNVTDSSVAGYLLLPAQ